MLRVIPRQLAVSKAEVSEGEENSVGCPMSGRKKKADPIQPRKFKIHKQTGRTDMAGIAIVVRSNVRNRRYEVPPPSGFL